MKVNGVISLLFRIFREFSISNTFGATAFTSYGCFWISYATLVQFVVPTWSGWCKFASVSASGYRFGVYTILMI